MPASNAELQSLAEAVVEALDGAAFETGHVDALRLTTGVYSVVIQEHGEHPSDPILIGEE